MNHIRFGQIGALRSRVGRRGMAIVGIVLVSVLIAFTSSTLLAKASSDPVLCLAAVSGSDNVPHFVYQTADMTREEFMQSNGLGRLIQEGYSVVDETCFATWQDAADHFTNGEVLLPENAEELDFVMAVRKWNSMNPK